MHKAVKVQNTQTNKFLSVPKLYQVQINIIINLTKYYWLKS